MLGPAPARRGSPNLARNTFVGAAQQRQALVEVQMNDPGCL